MIEKKKFWKWSNNLLTVLKTVAIRWSYLKCTNDYTANINECFINLLTFFINYKTFIILKQNLMSIINLFQFQPHCNIYLWVKILSHHNSTQCRSRVQFISVKLKAPFHKSENDRIIWPSLLHSWNSAHMGLHPYDRWYM